jgi:gas vesicle protein
MKNSFGLNIGFLFAGALIGGAAVALTTPLTGRRARRLVGKQIDRGSKQAQRSARELQLKGRKVYARGGEMLHKVEEAASRVAAVAR